ncbi:hypothetical protein ACT691_07240 [Vibrio metschnikovii]
MGLASEANFKIAAATDLVLAFLPFEKAFYDRFNVPCELTWPYLGRCFTTQPDKQAAQRLLGLDEKKRWLAVLPGSRSGEMKLLAKPFIETCQRLHQTYPELGFVVALVNSQRREQFEAVWQQE